MKLDEMLVRSDIRLDEKCYRDNCLLCRNESDQKSKKQSCVTRSVVYENKC